MSEIEIAQKKLAAWQSSLKDQKLRFFQLEDTKRNKARQELETLVKELDARVRLDTMIVSPFDVGPFIRSRMDKVLLKIQEIEYCTFAIWALMDNEETCEADILLDKLESQAMKSVFNAAQHLQDEYPSTTFSLSIEKDAVSEASHRAKLIAQSLFFTGKNRGKMNEFWKSFESEIGNNKFVADQDKFDMLKACCIEDAASFADTEDWQKDPHGDPYTQLSGALKTHFATKPELSFAQILPNLSQEQKMDCGIYFAQLDSEAVLYAVTAPIAHTAAATANATISIAEMDISDKAVISDDEVVSIKVGTLIPRSESKTNSEEWNGIFASPEELLIGEYWKEKLTSKQSSATARSESYGDEEVFAQPEFEKTHFQPILIEVQQHLSKTKDGASAPPTPVPVNIQELLTWISLLAFLALKMDVFCHVEQKTGGSGPQGIYCTKTMELPEWGQLKPPALNINRINVKAATKLPPNAWTSRLHPVCRLTLGVQGCI